MGFDAEWFNNLRKLDDNIIQQVPVPRDSLRIYPDMSDLQADNASVLHVFNNRFFDEMLLLTGCLRKKGYKFYRYFKIPKGCERHVVDFPEGRSCLGQWNIAFCAEDDQRNDWARIGVGFRTNDVLVSNSYTEYSDYVRRISQNQIGFNTIFSGALSYSEPFSIFSSSNRSLEIIKDLPAVDRFEDWRFFGRKLLISDSLDRKILEDVNMFAKTAIDIFSKIQAAGFAPC